MRPNTNLNINAASAAVDQHGLVIPALQLIMASAQAVVTGTSTGTLNIQASNDQPSGVDANGLPVVSHWSNISGATIAIAGAGNYLIPKIDVCYAWIRADFVHANSASGTISVNVQTSGI